VVAAAHSAGLIDSDILIDARRGFADGLAFLAAQAQAGRIVSSAISAMELVAGCRDSMELVGVQRFLATTTCLPISPTVSALALQWMEAFTLSHGLMIPDALIAATAAEYQVTLYTKNARHFQMLPGLSVIRPY
jgi:predicted nucleic acid-binding protein